MLGNSPKFIQRLLILDLKEDKLSDLKNFLGAMSVKASVKAGKICDKTMTSKTLEGLDEVAIVDKTDGFRLDGSVDFGVPPPDVVAVLYRGTDLGFLHSQFTTTSESRWKEGVMFN